MSDLNIKAGSLIHFIGIGGSSMSGLAEIVLHRGYKVSGSDNASTAITKRLESLGAKVFLGHSAANVDLSCALVVYTLAVGEQNPELVRARELSIPTIERGSFLGALSREYPVVTAVSGTHGKTTTTSMLASVLMEGGMDPSVHVGGVIPQFGSNVRTGGNKYFITEACEYHENFLNITPKIGIILNVEAEHLDYFGSIENVHNAFKKFIAGFNDGGALIVCADSPDALLCAKSANVDVITYSLDNFDAPEGFKNSLGNSPLHHYSAANISHDNGDSTSISKGYTFDILQDGKYLCHVALKVPGKHNILNALAAAAAAIAQNCPLSGIEAGINSFTGAGRRFDIAGEYNGVPIINDYAHHPTEVRSTVIAAKENCSGELWCVFQPHTYSRAKTFRKEFAEAFSCADHVVVTDIYAAREPFTDEISGKMLADDFSGRGIDAHYISDFGGIADFIKANVHMGDAVLLLGAGTIINISSMILE